MLANAMLRGVAARTAAPCRRFTHLVGVPFDAGARATLIGLYQQTLAEVATLPESALKSSLTATAADRLRSCEASEDTAMIEAAVGCGFVEELVIQAQEELALLPVLRAAQVWDAEPASVLASPTVVTHEVPGTLKPDIREQDEQYHPGAVRGDPGFH